MVSSTKINSIIDRLLAKTTAAEIKWSRSGQSDSFIARLDEFAFQLSKRRNTGVLSEVIDPITLEITRTDGTIIAKVTTSGAYSNALNSMNKDLVQLYGHQSDKLKQLHKLVSSGESDLDAILKLLD